MNELIAELNNLQNDLKAELDDAQKTIIWESLDELECNANELATAFCGSWRGHFAYTYYDGFKKPPEGISFSRHFGIGRAKMRTSDPGWIRFEPSEIETKLYDGLARQDIEQAYQIAKQIEEEFEKKRRLSLSLIDTVCSHMYMKSLSEISNRVEELSIRSERDRTNGIKPTLLDEYWFPDHGLARIIYVPVHVDVLIKMNWIRDVIAGWHSLTELLNEVQEHITISDSIPAYGGPQGDKVFISHGGNAVWKQLQDFVERRLKREVVEFDRSRPVSKHILDHIIEMIDDARVAFVVLTGEDELKNGKLHPRLNVVHELGLCQARLGSYNTIIFLENGCEEFSNIAGRVQIRFPTGNIMAHSEKLREELEERGIIPE